MEPETKYGNVHGAPPLPLGQPNNGLKFQVLDDDFCIDNFSSPLPKTYQDFHQLDQLPLIKPSPFNPDIDTDLTVFDPFFHGFDLYEDSKVYDHGNGIACSAMQSFQNYDGILNSTNRKDLFMEIDTALITHDPNRLNILVPDESSCVTEDHFHKEINSVRRGRFGATASTKKGRRKVKSGKGQWTAEEDK